MRTIISAILIALFLLATPVIADNDLTQQRVSYVQAMQALAKNDMEKFNTLRASLQSYPLYPYLEYAALTKDLSKVSEQQMMNFLATYANTPLAPLLRERWLLLQADEQHWSQFLKYYVPTENIELQCRRTQALLMTGQTQQAFAALTPLWLSGENLPPSCQSVATFWLKQGGLSSGLIFSRIAAAMEHNNISLVKRIMLLLPRLQQKQVIYWLKINADPMLVYQPDLIASLGFYKRMIVMDAILHLAAKNPERLALDWSWLQKIYSFSESEKQIMIRKLGLALATKNNPQALAWLAKVNDIYANQNVREWRIRAALQQNNWQQVSYWIARLPTSERNSAQWRYWQARALAMQGDNKTAKTIYQSLASQVDFYALLASQRLQQPYTPMAKTLSVDPQQLAVLQQIPAIQRARELYFVNDTRDARREWNFALDKMSDAQIPAMAVLASQWHWYDRAIELAMQSGIKSDLSLRYPVAYRQPILYFTNKLNVDPAWVLGIMHQESEFMADSRSSVGATGLMQLMPATAKILARGLHLHYEGDSTLLNINSNIGMGVAYLRDLLKQYRNDYILATASYNAGSGSVKKWLSNYDKMPEDIWIETIPWQETRNYVKKVTLNRAIYRQELNKNK